MENSVSFLKLTSIEKRFYTVINKNVTEKFAEYQDVLDSEREYSPLDYDASKCTSYTYKEFEEFANNIKFDGVFTYCGYFYVGNGNYERLYRDKDRWYVDYYKKQSLREIYDEYKPMNAERYLMSGKPYNYRGGY